MPTLPMTTRHNRRRQHQLRSSSPADEKDSSTPLARRYLLRIRTTNSNVRKQATSAIVTRSKVRNGAVNMEEKEEQLRRVAELEMPSTPRAVRRSSSRSRPIPSSAHRTRRRSTPRLRVKRQNTPWSCPRLDNAAIQAQQEERRKRRKRRVMRRAHTFKEEEDEEVEEQDLDELDRRTLAACSFNDVEVVIIEEDDQQLMRDERGNRTARKEGTAHSEKRSVSKNAGESAEQQRHHEEGNRFELEELRGAFVRIARALKLQFREECDSMVFMCLDGPVHLLGSLLSFREANDGKGGIIVEEYRKLKLAKTIGWRKGDPAQMRDAVYGRCCQFFERQRENAHKWSDDDGDGDSDDDDDDGDSDDDDDDGDSDDDDSDVVLEK